MEPLAMKKLMTVILLLALAGGCWWWWSKREAAAKPSYRPYKVESGDLVQTVQATGNVEPLNRLELRPPVAGRVEQVLVREGDYVKRGQILAWLSSSERAALLDAARAQGPEALARWEELYKATPLLAPLSGQVIARSTEPGQSVTAADVVLVLSDRLIVKAQVDETDIAKVSGGMEAEIRLDAYADQVVPGRVGHIAYEARTVNNVTMYDVDVTPSKVPPFMRSGMTANIGFVTLRHKGVLLLPLEALQSRRGDEAVVLVAEGEFSREDFKKGVAPKTVTKTVETGLDDGQQIEITDGLEEGQRVLALRQGLPSAAQGNNPFMPRRPQGQQRRAMR
jgi:macrolide-specific efflux system membrane fusion protein